MISDIGLRHNAWDNGQNPIVQEGRKKEFSDRVQQRLYLFQVVNAMAVFKNYLAGNLADRIRFLQSRTDMASLRCRRSYKICITSGSIYLALDSHLLVRI